MMDRIVLRNRILSVLLDLSVYDGARFIEGLVAEWVDKLVDRNKDAVDEPARSYVGEHGVPRIWAGLALGESHWRVLFSELYMRLQQMQLMESAANAKVLGAQPETSTSELSGMSASAASELSQLTIGAALDWLELLVREWAATYDRVALRKQIPVSEGTWPDDRLTYYPIKILTEIMEPS